MTDIWNTSLCLTALGDLDEDLRRNSFLQGPEGVLHVLQQLGKVCFDLSFAILNRILKDKMNVKMYYDIYR